MTLWFCDQMIYFSFISKDCEGQHYKEICWSVIDNYINKFVIQKLKGKWGQRKTITKTLATVTFHEPWPESILKECHKQGSAVNSLLTGDAHSEQEDMS